MIDGDINETRLVADGLDQLPRLTAVFRLVEPALRVRLPGGAEGGNVDDVRIRRVDGDAPDVLRLLKAHQLPREAAVRRFVDTGARLDGVAGVLLPGARPHLHGVGGCDSEGAHRHHGIAVEAGSEGRAVVGRLPDPTTRGGDEDGLGWARNADDVGNASLEVRRTDGSPAETGEGERIEGLRLGGGCGNRERCTGEEGEEPE